MEGKQGSRPGDRLLLEHAATQLRRTEAEMILDMLRSQPIVSADEARKLVGLRVAALHHQEQGYHALLTPLTCDHRDEPGQGGGIQ